jgi:hypothetical protein
MRYLILVISLATLSLGCSRPSKEDLKPTIRELGGGHWAFDRHPNSYSNPQAANEALQESLSAWILEHDELEVKMVFPLEFKNNGVTTILVITKRKDK